MSESEITEVSDSVIPVHCQDCGRGMPEETQLDWEYFKGEKRKCSDCGIEFDWWSYIFELVESRLPVFDHVLHPIGAKTKIIGMHLYEGSRLRIDLEEYGIGPASTILKRNYTPNSLGAAPLEWHGNDPEIKLNSRKILIVPIRKKEFHDGTAKVVMTVQWVPWEADSYAANHLIDGVLSYYSSGDSMCLLSCNVALESKLSPIINSYIRNYTNKKRADSAMNNDLNYSTQINIMLPILCETYKLPMLPVGAVSDLNDLRKARNEIAHEGGLSSKSFAWRNEKTAAMITSSIIAFSYFRLLEKEVFGSKG